jgi:hypothetical protein
MGLSTVRAVGEIKLITANKTLVADGDYAALDVLSNSKTAGTAFQFANVARYIGGSGYIVKAKVTLSKATGVTAITPRFILMLYNSAPTCNLNDNNANTGVLHADIAKHVGDIEFPPLRNFGGSPQAIVTPSTSGNLPMAFKCASSKDLWGVLVTQDAITDETAGMTATIDLEVEQY